MIFISSIIKLFVFFYKNCISPYTISSCRFVPNCSTYASDALNKLPLRVAVIRIIGRIFRCHPFNKSSRLDRV